MTVIGDCRKKLSTAEGEVTVYSLRELEKQGIISDLRKKPYSIRVLIESLLRQKDGRLITDEDVRNEVFRILDEAGTVGVGLGADCTIGDDVPVARMEYIRRLAGEYGR